VILCRYFFVKLYFSATAFSRKLKKLTYLQYKPPLLMSQEKNKISSSFYILGVNTLCGTGDGASINQCRLKCLLAQICNGFFRAGKWPQPKPVAVMPGRQTVLPMRPGISAPAIIPTYTHLFVVDIHCYSITLRQFISVFRPIQIVNRKSVKTT
jgi:hypothetical protein